MAELQRFVAQLRAAESVLATERMDASAARRIARRFAAAGRARRVWWRPYLPAMCFAAGAVLVLVLHVWQRRPLVADAMPAAEQSALQDPATSCEEPVVAPTTMPAATLPPVALPAPIVVTPEIATPPPVRAPTVRRDRSAATPEVAPQTTAEDRVAALLAELRALRRAGRYAEAARRLERALAESWPTRAREVLHYELGTIVGNHLDDRERACAHWRTHLQEFRSTRYARAIADAQQRLGCE